jgi:hypothetical protein
VQVVGGAHVAAGVLADLDVLDLFGGDGVQHTAGLLGALGRVLRQVARPLPALVLIAAELLHIQLLAPAHLAAAELVGHHGLDIHHGLAQRLLQQPGREALVRWPDLTRAVGGHPAIQVNPGCRCTSPRRWYSLTLA